MVNGRTFVSVASTIVLVIIGTSAGQQIAARDGSRAVHAVPLGGAIRRQSISLSPSSENILNPERGFFLTLNPYYIGGQRTPVDSRFLGSLRAQGIGIVKAYYVIDQFRDRPLSQDFLGGIAADFDAVRSAGFKIIPRFTYNFPCAGDLEPCNLDGNPPPDASVTQVLEHIDQLAPLLRTNGDVIAFMEAGFVGAWGEWHHSTNQLINADTTANASSSAIVNRLLFALPEQRMLAFRYPHHKQELFGTNALQEAQAFTSTPAARIGAHNDCFLSNAHDSGTYTAPTKPFTQTTFEAQRGYLSLDNRFVPQGGETCSAAPEAQPYIGCANALKDLAALHYSVLNVGYQPEVIALWKQDGCFAQIQQRLGYRFRLVNIDAPTDARAGDPLSVAFTIANDGWAAAYNPRAALLIFRHAQTGRLLVWPIAEDPRRWGGGETHEVTVTVTIPPDADSGEYQVLLNFPDPDPRLWNQPEYAIRLANDGVWEASSGSNVLPFLVRIGR